MPLVKRKKKVIVGMSGGVDSSVAAVLLLEQGYEVMGVFMKNFDPTVFFKKAKGVAYDYEHGCHWQEDQEDARVVCQKLGIGFKIWNFEKEYYQEVMEYFLAEYGSGRTPNPDVLCNRQVKFGAFFKKAMAAGADFIATGHYARKQEMTEVENSKSYRLLKGVDRNKDQSYFLYSISQSALSKTLFPIGDLTKVEVREIAKMNGLITSDKKDSQGICFVGEIDLKKFLQEYIKDEPGEIIDEENGEKIGQHDGLAWYTIGQRKGMKVGGTGVPIYVSRKDMKKNILYVVKGNYNPLLFKQELIATQPSWIYKAPGLPQRLQAKIRYRQPDQFCDVDWQESGETLRVLFAEAQRAVTPGQSIVFYQGDHCLGGAIIRE